MFKKVKNLYQKSKSKIDSATIALSLGIMATCPNAYAFAANQAVDMFNKIKGYVGAGLIAYGAFNAVTSVVNIANGMKESHSGREMQDGIKGLVAGVLIAGAGTACMLITLDIG